MSSANPNVGKLTVTTRTRTGKGAARQLRTSGSVPGVLYGASTEGKVEPVSIVVDVKALRAALDPVRKQNTVIDLTIEGDAGPRRLSALLREYQIHPIRRDVTHVDLLAIDPTKEVNAEVPLDFVGKHAGAIDGGQLHIVLRSLQVRCKPQDIPVKLDVDVTPLTIGDVLHVSDLKLPDGVASITGLGQAVVTCTPPEIERAAEPAVAAEGAAPAAGAAAAPAAGAKDAKAPAAAGGGKDAKAPAPAAAAKGGKK
jgi:large subunit ribosomal protein L25